MVNAIVVIREFSFGEKNVILSPGNLVSVAKIKSNLRFQKRSCSIKPLSMAPAKSVFLMTCIFAKISVIVMAGENDDQGTLKMILNEIAQPPAYNKWILPSINRM